MAVVVLLGRTVVAAAVAEVVPAAHPQETVLLVALALTLPLRMWAPLALAVVVALAAETVLRRQSVAGVALVVYTALVALAAGARRDKLNMVVTVRRVAYSLPIRLLRRFHAKPS